MGRSVSEIPEDVLEILVEYDWPGNVRELENVMERAVVLRTEGAAVELSDLPDKLVDAYIGKRALSPDISYKDAKKQAVDSFSREFLRRLLQVNEGNVSQAANQAGMDAANFRRLVRKFGIRGPEHEQK